METKRDLDFADALRLAHKVCRDEDIAQEAVLHAWARLTRGKTAGKEYPVRYALWCGIRDAKAGRKLRDRADGKAGRIAHASDAANCRPITTPSGLLPLSQDDYTGRRGLVCAQEYRMALATDDASVIDALFAA